MTLIHRFLLLTVGILFFSQLSAQPCFPNRYQERIFDSLTVTTDIVFGNVDAVTNPYVDENVTFNMDLKLDLFEPAGDTIAQRPLVILAFGGGFLLGSKEDEDIQATCDSLAHLGYVTASINYRLGMSVLLSSSAERAVYRGIQDFSAAVRFFKEFATLYRIDTNYIFAGGVSAGSISALQMAFGEEADRPASTYNVGLAPDLGCVDCSGNSYNHSSSNVKALINCWGAMGDVNWIEPGEDVPIISFHGDQDLVVPYDSGFPFTALATMPYVYGSLPISQRADAIGLNNEFTTFVGEGHNVWGTVVNNSFTGGPTQYFQPILDSISDFLFPFLKPNTGLITGGSAGCEGSVLTYSVPPTNGSIYCWSAQGGTIVTVDSTTNSIDVQWNTPGQHQISVVESNQFQALGDTQTYTVEIAPLPDITFTSSGEGCAPYVFAAFVSGSGSVPIASWLWDFGDGAYSTDAFTVSHVYTSAGNYDVTLIATSDQGCVDTITDSGAVSVYPIPQAEFDIYQFGAPLNPTLVSISSPTVDFVNMSNGNIASIFWDFGDPPSGVANNSTLFNPSHTYSDTGLFTVMQLVESTEGCTDTIFHVLGVCPDVGPCNINVGIHEPLQSGWPIIYPNPAQRQVYIKLGQWNDVNIKLMNTNGQLLQFQENAKGPNYLLTTTAPPGIYFIEIIYQGTSYRDKLVIR